MAEAHIGPLPQGTKHYRVCAEPINQRAIRCIHCQSDQGRWRLRLGLSTTVLSLLVALTAVMTAAVPVVKDILTPENSRLIWSLQGTNLNTFAVLVANRGIRSGSLGTFYLEIDGANEIRALGVVPSGEDHPAFVVDAGKAKLMELTIERSYKDDPEMKNFVNTVKKCELHATFVDFLGHQERRTLALDCQSGVRPRFFGYGR